MHAFRGELKAALENVSTYSEFEETFLKILEKHAPSKQKVYRANDKPYMTKALRRAIMLRSSMKNKYMKFKTPDLHRAYKKQKNFTNRLLKKERKRFFSNLDLKNITDNKKFWQTVKPLFGNSGATTNKINLVEDEEVIADDGKIAETFNDFFDKAVCNLNLVENTGILNDANHLLDPVGKALYKFKDHPSILEIKKHVVNDAKFSFSRVTEKEMIKQIEVLNTKKSGTFMNIPTQKLKDAKEEIAKPLTLIWNEQILVNMKFPSKLKLADIIPPIQEAGSHLQAKL